MDYYITGFGAVDMENPYSFYDDHFERDGHLVNIDLSFTGAPVAEEILERVENLLARRDELGRLSWELIDAEALKENGGIVGEFTENILRDLPKESHYKLIDEQDPAPLHLQVRRKMEWRAISFVPEEESMFVCFVYSVNWSISHDTIVLYYNSKGEFNSVAVYA